MKGSCQIISTSTRPINEILEETPAGKIAMFRVTSISSMVEDHVCGEMVYIKNGRVLDFASDTVIIGLTADNLLFISYINWK